MGSHVTFKCALCGGVFEQDWTDEEAIAEAKENGFDTDDCGVVCEDCYKMTPWGGGQQQGTGVLELVALGLACFALGCAVMSTLWAIWGK